MRDITNDKLYFSKAAQDQLRAPFARAGHDIRHIDTVEKALDAWVGTLSDEAARRFSEEIERRSNQK